MKRIEYEFVLPDGTKRYEMVDPDFSVMAQVNAFMWMHRAYIAHVVQRGTVDDGSTSAIPSSEQQLGQPTG